MDQFRKNGVIFKVENLNLTLGGKHVLRDINLEVHKDICDFPIPEGPKKEIISGV
jgi:ABC-type phosphate transport system ATPase subunit